MGRSSGSATPHIRVQFLRPDVSARWRSQIAFSLDGFSAHLPQSSVGGVSASEYASEICKRSLIANPNFQPSEPHCSFLLINSHRARHHSCMRRIDSNVPLCAEIHLGFLVIELRMNTRDLHSLEAWTQWRRGPGSTRYQLKQL